MSTNNAQPTHTPSEPLILNDKNVCNINQLLSVQILTTSQPSLIQFNPTEIIPNLTPDEDALIPFTVRQQPNEFHCHILTK
jgi:hypothetical protein